MDKARLTTIVGKVMAPFRDEVQIDKGNSVAMISTAQHDAENSGRLRLNWVWRGGSVELSDWSLAGAGAGDGAEGTGAHDDEGGWGRGFFLRPCPFLLFGIVL